MNEPEPGFVKGSRFKVQYSRFHIPDSKILNPKSNTQNPKKFLTGFTGSTGLKSAKYQV